MSSKTEGLEKVKSEIVDVERKVTLFGDLLGELSTSDEKRKYLWKEIYSNAVEDRASAQILYISLFSQLMQHDSDHLTKGQMLVRYLERMHRSNEQLLKLAEMIKASEDESSTIVVEDCFDEIEKGM